MILCKKDNIGSSSTATLGKALDDALVAIACKNPRLQGTCSASAERRWDALGLVFIMPPHA
jgi:hypothetical protein